MPGRTRLKYAGALLVVLTVLVISVALGRALAKRPFISVTSGGDDVPSIESTLGIKLLESAVVEFVERDGFLDEYILLKFRMPRSGWPEFLGTTPLTADSLSTQDRYVAGYESDANEWNAGSAENFLSGQRQSDGSAMNILAVFDDPAMCTVYIEWFETQ